METKEKLPSVPVQVAYIVPCGGGGRGGGGGGGPRQRESRRGCEGADGSATQPAKKRHHAGKAERMQSSPPTRELYIGGW